MGSRKRVKPNPPSAADPVDRATGLNVPPCLPSSPSNPAALNLDHPAEATGASSPSNSQEATRHSSTQAVVCAHIERGARFTRQKAYLKQPPPTRSWYGGTWPRIPKSTPVTQVLRESISATSSTNTHGTSSPYSSSLESHSVPTGISVPPKSPSLSLSLSSKKSSRSLPAAAATTKVNITSSGIVDPPVPETKSIAGKQDFTKMEDPVNNLKSSSGAEDQEAKIMPRPIDHAALTRSGWLGWFSRQSTAVNEDQKLETIQRDVSNAEAPLRTAEPETTDEPTTRVGESIPLEREDASNHIISPSPPPSRTWFGLWTGGSLRAREAETPDLNVAATKSESTTERSTKADPEIEGQEGTPNPLDLVMAEAPPIHTTNTMSVSDGPSGWAFWSREKPKPKDSSTPGGGSIGEMAVANTPSQSHPETARCKENETPTTLDVPKLGQRARPKYLEASDDPTVTSIQPSSSSQPLSTPISLSKQKPAEAAIVEKPQKALPPNLLLPQFRTTYHGVETPSILQQIARLLLQGRNPANKLVHIVREPPVVKKAVAIGIHGYFPAPLIRTVLGQPTGTSIRFANAAATAIRKWTGNRGYECEIEKVALEGEGKIGERVDTLWKLLLNWIDHIQKADFILVACHSQGVPVAVMLVAKLVEFGCVNSARIGVCAMAGVNLGPFPDYKSRLFNGSAGELFEFSNPDSAVSKTYEDALRVVVMHGVRLLLVGSIDDQLVSLESSTFSTISHPYIYRAVFVDGRVHAPDFITHVVGFALKLRNLGISDHGLIRELSSPLAGSLYSGEGHSRIYDDEIVYDLGVEHALETSSVGEVPLEIKRYEGPATNNPYILPWSMRGLLEEEYVRTELYNETTELLQQFDNWKPTSKVLKDVKFRLEAVKSKL